MATSKKTTAKKTTAKKTTPAKTTPAKTTAKKTTAKKTTPAKPTKPETVAEYIASLGDWRAAVVEQLCALIVKAAPQATSSIKWAQPVFEDHGPFCYVRGFKSHVNFGFWRGVDLPDPKGQLHSGGKKMAHVKITGPQDIDAPMLTKLVKAAVKLNRSEGDPTKG